MLKKYWRGAKTELKSAKIKINQLEHALRELHSRLMQQEQVEENEEREDERAEEVKEEVPTIINLEELAERLHCDASNPDELRSLQLALQLEAEERQEEIAEAQASMQKLLLVQQQDMALRALDNDPESISNVNPDVMTYEQLLELEEKMGSVSKGLNEKAIAVFIHTYTYNFLNRR